jgi:hypothetical protein
MIKYISVTERFAKYVKKMEEIPPYHNQHVFDYMDDIKSQTDNDIINYTHKEMIAKYTSSIYSITIVKNYFVSKIGDGSVIKNDFVKLVYPGTGIELPRKPHYKETIKEYKNNIGPEFKQIDLKTLQNIVKICYNIKPTKVNIFKNNNKDKLGEDEPFNKELVTDYLKRVFNDRRTQNNAMKYASQKYEHIRTYRVILYDKNVKRKYQDLDPELENILFG